MVVGILRFKILIRDSHSLKEKRQVINSLKDRLRQRFNISLAEMGAHGHRQQCHLTAAMVANNRKYVNSSLSLLVDSFRGFPHVELIDYELELI